MADALTRFQIEGFSSLDGVTIEPGRLTVLVGANGSGKSNVLRALRLATMTTPEALRHFVGEAGGATSLLHYGPKRTTRIKLRLDFSQLEQGLRYQAVLAFGADDSLFFESASFGLVVGGIASIETAFAGPTAWSVDRRLGDMAQLHFHDTSMTSALRTHARVEDDRALRSDGGNVAAYLHRLASSDIEGDQVAWKRINLLVNRIAPSVRELAPTLTGRTETHVRLDWIDDRGERFGAHQLSDGTLRAIALVTALAQPLERMPRFISIDEPELGLHPAAIRLIADLARSVSHHTQVLFATQSTSFLDQFEPDEIVVVERKDGATTLTRPDPAALAKWLEEYTLSEVFDKGILGGRP